MDWAKNHVKTLSYLSGLPEAVVEQLFLRPVRIELDPTVRGNRTYELAYTTAVNLVARVFPKISFDALGGSALAIAPWGNFQPQQTESAVGASVLSVGSKALQSPNTVSLLVENWRVKINSSDAGRADESWNPMLAIVGASYGASALAKVVLGEALTGALLWPEFSILDFLDASASFDFDAQLDIGVVHLAGVGAIGSAFLYCLLAHGRAFGTLHLVDKDKVDFGNLGRYPLFDVNDIDIAKVIAARERLSIMQDLKVLPHELLFEDYCKGELRKTKDFRVEGLVSAPDKRETRRRFQHELPRRLWDASTGPDQIVVHANSYAPEWACLSCVYSERADEDAPQKHLAEMLGLSFEDVKRNPQITPEMARLIVGRYTRFEEEELVGKDCDSIFRDLCSANELRAGDEVVLAPMSFTSMLAGAYLYLEFLKSFAGAAFENMEPVNYILLNPLFPPNPYLRERRPSRRGCSCQTSAYRRAFQQIWK